MAGGSSDDFAKRIVDASFEEELSTSFGRYARTTILDRAIPDVRDGLKPVQRRIIYAMFRAGNTPDKKYQKSAKTVGEVMGKFHPHGDSSIYEALVRLAQSWKMRAMLVDGHGNFGSIDDDPPAAMRYTEARLAPLSMELVSDIDKDTVRYQPTFDDTQLEPTVLPAAIPTLIVNGTSGVSTGFATEVPPHNLGEVIDALVALIDLPSIDLDGLLQHVKGPDFPTGGIAIGLDDLREAYATGRGRVVLRARTRIDTRKDGRQTIVVTEIPYGVIKTNLVREIERLKIDKVVPGLVDVIDETDREGLRISIELGRGIEAEPVLAYLFKKTELSVYHHFNMVAIVDRTPKLLSLREILDAYLAHRRDVVTRRSRYDLQHAQDRLHLVEGLIRAVDLLDAIIAAIRSSNDRAEAHGKLTGPDFGFSDAQAKEILDLRLHRLTGLQLLELRAEAEALRALISELERILGSDAALMGVIRAELLDVQKRFADPRRTEMRAILEREEPPKKLVETVTVKEQPCVVGVSRDGYVKRSAMLSYEKGGGRDAGGTKDGDVLRWVFETTTTQRVLLFTARGQCYGLPVHQLPEAKWGEVGTALVNVVDFAKDTDRLVDVLVLPALTEQELATFVMRDGQVKRTPLSDFDTSRATGVLAVKLDEGSEVVRVLWTGGGGELLVGTREGMVIRFLEDEVPLQGRQAGGVRGIKLDDHDRVVDALVLPQSPPEPEEPLPVMIASITEEGRAKKTPLADFPRQKRAGRGLRAITPRQRLPHRVVALACWDRDAEPGATVLVTAGPTRTAVPAALIRGAARDGTVHPMPGVTDKDKVSAAEVRLVAGAAPLPPPLPEPEPVAEKLAPVIPLAPPPPVEGRGGWAKGTIGFLPGFEPEDP